MILIFPHKVYCLEGEDEYKDETSRPEAAETNTVHMCRRALRDLYKHMMIRRVTFPLVLAEEVSISADISLSSNAGAEEDDDSTPVIDERLEH
jgi:hypothetical protein